MVCILLKKTVGSVVALLKVKKKFKFYLVLLLSICFLAFYFRENILLQIGDFLLYDEKPEKADVVVLLRGGLFDRTIQVAELYKKEFGDKILIPMSLNDNKSKQFKEYGVTLPTGQEQIKSILQQLNTSADNIILSTQSPGGGTIGEAYRVKRDLLEMGISNFIVVTTWYHTKRVHNIYNEIFGDTDMEFWVVSSKYGESNSKNWWHYRYITLAVLFEFPRLCISYLRPTFNFSFRDDPRISK